MNASRRKTPQRALALVAIAILVLLPVHFARANHVAFARGDVLVAIATGKVNHFAADGTLLETLDTTTGGDIAGMCLDAALNLYTTNFGSNSMSKFDNKGALLEANFGSPAPFFVPESCALDGFGNIYVGQATNPTPQPGEGHVLKFDQGGNLLAEYAPAIGPRGSDWLDVAADQCTLYYASEGTDIRRFNACTNTQLPDFCSDCGEGLRSLRIRPDGSVIVESTDEGVNLLLDSSGALVRTYSTPGPIGLDPDGTSFWTEDSANHEVFRFDIATGAVLKQFGSGAPPGDRGFGIAVVGGPTAAVIQLTAWLGLKNSDDVGTNFDLKAELFVGASKVAEGQANNVSGASSGFNRAVLRTIPLTFADGAVPVPGTSLAIKVSVRRTCFGGGHNSGTARLWFNGQPVDSGPARDAGSRFNAILGGGETDYFLRDGFALSSTAGSSKLSLDATVNSVSPCPSRPFIAFGTWSITP